MSDPFEPDPFHAERSAIARPYSPLPAWLAARLLRAGEQITWVRGPQLSPWWERYVTHLGLFFAALPLGILCLLAGRLWAGSWRALHPLPAVVAGGIIMGSIYMLGIANAYFTRLVVTTERLVLLQGYDMYRSWRLDDLPHSLLRYGRRGGAESRTIDLDALQTMLGGASDQFAEAKTLRKFGKMIDRIKADDTNEF